MPEELTYTITVTVERSDGAELETKMSGIRAADAEAEDYPLAVFIHALRTWTH